MGHRCFILSNGITVMHMERPGPISVRTAFRSGSRYDPIGKDGLAHFAEHLLTAGTERYPSKNFLSERIEALGGELSAATGTELLHLTMHIAEAEDFPVIPELLDQMLNHSLCDAQIFASEKGAVLRERSTKLANPSQNVWQQYFPLFYEGSVVGRRGIGSLETIDAFTVDEVRDFIARQLTIEKMYVLVAGDISREAIKDAFSPYKFSSSKAPFTREYAGAIGGGSISDDFFPNSKQVDFLLGFRACGYQSNDQYALKIIQNTLGGGRTASLMKSLRQDKGLVYAGFASLMHHTEDDGSWVFQSACAADDLQETLDIITAEFRRIYEGKITQDEIAFAKNKIIKSTAMQLQTSAQWVQFMQAAIFGIEGTLAEFTYGIAGCTAEDIARVGEKYFAPGSWFLALAGGVREKDIIVNY